MAHIFSNNELALSVFNDLAEKMTGKRLERTGSTDIPDDLIVIGNESDNSYVANKMLDGSWEIPVYRTGSDDYFIHSYSENGRKVLVLGGGRPRAFLYAVYAYFEKIGCSYFWDGDIVPHKDTLELEDFLSCRLLAFERISEDLVDLIKFEILSIEVLQAVV